MANTLTRAGMAGVGAVVVFMLMASIAWGMPGGAPVAHDPERVLRHMSKRLDLSDEQREGVASLLTTAQQVTQQDRARLRELRRQLQAQSSAFEPEVAQRTAEEIGVITTRLSYQMASTRAEIAVLLNEEQRQKMQEFRQRRERAGGRWRHCCRHSLVEPV